MELILNAAVSVCALAAGGENNSAVFDRTSGQTLLLNGRVSALANLLALEGGLTFGQVCTTLKLDQETLGPLVHELASYGIIEL